MSLKYIELKHQNKTTLSSSQRYKIYSTNLLFKRLQIKKQQNREINALLKGVGFAKGALWVDNSKALDKEQYLLVQ